VTSSSNRPVTNGCSWVELTGVEGAGVHVARVHVAQGIMGTTPLKLVKTVDVDNLCS